MKKKHVNYLRTTAANLPTVFEKQKVSVVGSDILKENPEAKDGDGKPISPQRIYTTLLPKPVNHENRLKQLWDKTPDSKRQQAIQAYCDAAYDLHQSQLKKANDRIEESIQSV